MKLKDSSHRTNHSQLPQGNELLEIFNREEKRPIPKGKETKHFVDLKPMLSWLDILGLPKDFITQKPTEKLEDAIVMPEALQDDIAKRTLELLKSNPQKMMTVVKMVTKYLGESDIPQPSDLIFVFGAPGLYRIEAGVDLWKQRLAPTLFISGGRPAYKPEAESEAIKYQQYAIDHGVPENTIVLHDNAISITDNVRGGLNKLDELEVKYNNMILVTSWFVQRRCWAHMMKYTPEGTQLFRVNAPSNPTGGLTEDDWFKSERGIKTIIGECFKLRVAELQNIA